MTDPILELDYVDFDGEHPVAVRRAVIAETPWALYVDGRELLTFMCSPVGLHHLALGFLLSEGIIAGLDDVWQLKVHLDENLVYFYFAAAGLNGRLKMHACDESVGSIVVRLRRPAPEQRGRRVLTSGCGGGVTFDDLVDERAPLTSDLRISATQVAELMQQLNQSAGLYRASRGVHTSALACADELMVLAEDVGRHNTLDKIRGACLLDGTVTQDKILVSSGRISSEMITKAYKMGVPIVISRTSPTVMSIRLARAWNISLIGYVRGRRLRVYTGAERVTFF